MPGLCRQAVYILLLPDSGLLVLAGGPCFWVLRAVQKIRDFSLWESLKLEKSDPPPVLHTVSTARILASAETYGVPTLPSSSSFYLGSLWELESSRTKLTRIMPCCLVGQS